MNRLFLLAAPLALAAAACSAGPGGPGSNGSADTNGSGASVDSIGCGDGTKSTPNAWFMSAPSADNGGLFQEVALMSSNLFTLSGISPVNPASQSGSTAYPQDTSQTTALIFNVSFTPGVDSLAFPTIAEDSVKNRDTVLTQLQALGATISCNTIGVANPLNGSGSGGSAGDGGAGSTPDSAGCGDGVTSTPNIWFVQISQSSQNAPLFSELVLMSSNLFSVDSGAAINPAAQSGSTVFPVDVTQTTAIDFQVSFTPGVDSVSFPTIADDSIAFRNSALLTLRSDGVDIECNAIGVANPLGQ